MIVAGMGGGAWSKQLGLVARHRDACEYVAGRNFVSSFVKRSSCHDLSLYFIGGKHVTKHGMVSGGGLNVSIPLKRQSLQTWKSRMQTENRIKHFAHPHYHTGVVSLVVVAVAAVVAVVVVVVVGGGGVVVVVVVLLLCLCLLMLLL